MKIYLYVLKILIKNLIISVTQVDVESRLYDGAHDWFQRNGDVVDYAGQLLVQDCVESFGEFVVVQHVGQFDLKETKGIYKYGRSKRRRREKLPQFRQG